MCEERSLRGSVAEQPVSNSGQGTGSSGQESACAHKSFRLICLPSPHPLGHPTGYSLHAVRWPFNASYGPALFAMRTED